MTVLHLLLTDGLIPSTVLCRLLTVYQVSAGRLPNPFWIIVFLGCLREVAQLKLLQGFAWCIKTADHTRELLQSKITYDLIT